MSEILPTADFEALQAQAHEVFDGFMPGSGLAIIRALAPQLGQRHLPASERTEIVDDGLFVPYYGEAPQFAGEANRALLDGAEDVRHAGIRYATHVTDYGNVTYDGITPTVVTGAETRPAHYDLPIGVVVTDGGANAYVYDETGRLHALPGSLMQGFDPYAALVQAAIADPYAQQNAYFMLAWARATALYGQRAEELGLEIDAGSRVWQPIGAE